VVLLLLWSSAANGLIFTWLVLWSSLGWCSSHPSAGFLGHPLAGALVIPWLVL